MILASFRNQKDLLHAAALLRSEHSAVVETYTAEEIEDDSAAPSTVSPVPIVILVAGILGAVGMFLMQTYSTTIGYPVDIGGKPDFSWPSFIPNAFEVGVLLAIGAGFAAFMVVNRMPCLYRPIDEASMFHAAMRDGNFLAVRKLDPIHAYALLDKLHADRIEEVAE